MTVARRLLSEGFRAFFFAALAFAVVSMLAWLLWLAAPVLGETAPFLPFGEEPVLWHAHEMVFGYGSAALGGFLLTAVPSWTGTPAARMGFIGFAAALWLGGRLAVWLAPLLPPPAVALAALAFLPVVMARVADQLRRRPKPQNVAFLFFLVLAWLADLRVQIAWMQGEDAHAGLLAGLLTLGAMIAVIGGRVTPAFTRNAMKRAGEAEARWPVSLRAADLAAIFATTAAALLTLLGSEGALTAGLLCLAGLAQLLRLMRWRLGFALGQPILWSLHLGMAALGLGLLALGLSGFGLMPEGAAVHVLGIGAVGGMTLAVMSRAILGHTGRGLVAPGPVALAYALLPLAALTRAGAEWAGAGLYLALLVGAALLWVAAFAATLAALWPAISGPRADAGAAPPPQGIRP
ncbi:uncharacterized protein involved in response to NO [Meinhardsimonia xiamenensis]|jgi:uncharacterized protein involved in response to NO|uniref:Uncharacterized protein involved in response to NO n=1 Tax=Meinhardsimonia xiamenensis TaxID=990712 RepID=A0A1G9DBM9_9RHOB|nr:NnrS family protein [Meinhardsimonia xiamenensis]PRX38058.1 uncharacterized protein involved in response to NO [Meinhardsimonia xiamenensis]SDK61204.1 uncharacterized protein involved in response to NO [Meinhardsimonia xiamenensis]